MDAETASEVDVRGYWKIWGVLLVLTLAMVGVESMSMGRGAVIVVLGLAMLVKATLISGWFMHLRSEPRVFTISFVVTTLLTVIVLYLLIAPDGIDMNTKSVNRPVAEEGS